MYTCLNCDDESSVYSEVSRLLSSRSNWKLIQTSVYNNINAHLIFAHRNHIPFKLLGTYQGRKQVVNYYRGSTEICRKSSHARLVKSNCEDSELHDWFLPSFAVTPWLSESDPSLTKLQQAKIIAQRKKDERQPFLQAHRDTKNKVWIAKSSTGAKGDGILISDDPEKLIAFVDGSKEAHVIQKYIENPMLLDGNRKFDIRVWVILDHNMDIQVFKQGVLRTSSEVYKTDDLTDLTSHLTNHCVQEAMSANYSKYEEGNELFFDEFNSYLKSKFGTDIEEKILPQIYNIVKDSIYMIKDKLDPTDVAYHSFQLFGFDFMLDDDFKVWLLEINHSPGCAKKLLPSLAESIVTQVIDKICEQGTQQQKLCDTFFTIKRGS